MDIVSRKLTFVQEFLRLSDEEIIGKLEKLLRSEKKKRLSSELSPLSLDEFNSVIENSESDFDNGRVVEAKDLLHKIEKWK